MAKSRRNGPPGRTHQTQTHDPGVHASAQAQISSDTGSIRLLGLHPLLFVANILIALLLPLCGNWIASLTFSRIAPYGPIIVTAFCLLGLLQVLSISVPNAHGLDGALVPQGSLTLRIKLAIIGYLERARDTVSRPEALIENFKPEHWSQALLFFITCFVLQIGIAWPSDRGTDPIHDLRNHAFVVSIAVVAILVGWRTVRVKVPLLTATYVALHVVGILSLALAISLQMSVLFAFRFVPELSRTGGNSLTPLMTAAVACASSSEAENCLAIINGVSVDLADLASNPFFIGAMTFYGVTSLFQMWLHLRLWVGMKRAFRVGLLRCCLAFIASYLVVSVCSGFFFYSLGSTGLTTSCVLLKVPSTPEFNTAPIQFGDTPRSCNDEPLIDVQAIGVNNSISRSSSQAEHNMPVHIERGARFLVRIFIQNGAEDTTSANEQRTTARNVRLKFQAGPPGTLQHLSANVSADNAPQITSASGSYGGDIVVTSDSPLRLKYVPQSTRVLVYRTQAYERYGAPTKEALAEAASSGAKDYPRYTFPDTLEDGWLALGSIKAGYAHQTWVMFFLQAVETGDQQKILPYVVGEKSRLARRLSEDAPLYVLDLRGGSDGQFGGLSVFKRADEFKVQGKPKDAIQLYRSALQGNPDVSVRAAITSRLCSLLSAEGDRTDAIQTCNDAVRLFAGPPPKDGWTEREGANVSVYLSCELAKLYQAEGKSESALAAYNRILDISRNRLSDDPGSKASALYGMGGLFYQQSEWSHAFESFRDASKEFHRAGNLKAEEQADRSSGAALHGLGNMLYRQSAWGKALSTYRQAETVFHRVGAVNEEATMYVSCGNVFYAQASWDDALREYRSAAEGYHRSGKRSAEADAIASSALVLMYKHDKAGAALAWKSADEIYRDLGYRSSWGNSAKSSMELYLNAGGGAGGHEPHP